MAVRFIIGRSGTGKTKCCFDGIIDELMNSASDQNLILLVPEQSTYLCERAILNDSRINGFSRLHVLSFDRLSFWLSKKGSTLPALSKTGRQLIVNNILRHNADQLRVFNKSADSVGMASRLCDIIVEMHKYENTPADILEMIKIGKRAKLDEITLGKFADIHLIYSEYLKFVDGRFANPEIHLTNSREEVAASNFIKKSKIWVDGFSSFNVQERELLIEMISVCEQANIAFCIDPDSEGLDVNSPEKSVLPEDSLFYPTEQTFCQLSEQFHKRNIDLKPTLVLRKNHRHINSISLAGVEENIFNDNSAGNLYNDGKIKLCKTKNIRTELEFIAGRISELIRSKYCRYHDISLIIPDIELYANYIPFVFREYDIPFFVDQKRSMNHHVLIELINSSLHIVTDSDNTADIISCLKTGLLNITECQAQRLENYCVENGIELSDWITDRPWIDYDSKNTPKVYPVSNGEEALDICDVEEGNLDLIKKRAIKEIAWLYKKAEQYRTPQTLTASEFVKCVFEFIEKLNLPDKLSVYIDDAINENDHQYAQEIKQLYQQFIELLDEIVQVFGNEKKCFADFAEILKDAVSQIELTFIPPTQDQVMIGSIERTRHPDIKVAFLAGATSKQFPIPVSQTGILTDDDKLAAEQFGLEFSDKVSNKLLSRQYFVYIALTRASEYLYITYPMQNSKGALQQRSGFLDSLCSLFDDGLPESFVAGNSNSFEKVYNEDQLKDNLSLMLGRDGEGFDSSSGRVVECLYEKIHSDDDLAKLAVSLERSIKYQNQASIDKDVLKHIYPAPFTCSVSRLSTFASCPFKHFANYILRLKERKQFKLQPMDVGTFYHSVLEEVSKEMISEKKSFCDYDKSQLIELVRRNVEKCISENKLISNFKDKSIHSQFIVSEAIDTIEDCVLGLAQMSSSGRFKLKATELRFGKNDFGLGTCELKSGDGFEVKLNGSIDRLDLAEVNGKLLAVVFDYKTFGKKVSWSEIYHGLNLQLMVYMIALKDKTFNSQKIEPVGAFFLPIVSAPQKIEYDELEKESQSFRYPAKGLLNGEYFKALDTTAVSGSRYYSFRLKSDGTQYGWYSTGPMLNPDDFENLLNYSENKILDLAGKILLGKIDVSPFRLGKNSPCSKCEYKSLCRFDWQLNDYNFLENMGKSEVLDLIKEGVC